MIAETVAPNGDVTRYRYDDHANLVELVDAHGGVSRATYDAWGRCTSAIDASGATTRYTYSNGGRVLSVASPDRDSVHYEYDQAGRVTAITNVLGRMTQAYGGLDRLCEIVAPNGERVSLRYDREGRLSTVTNARGEVHRFVRRLDGLVVEEHTFDGRKLRFKHDAIGRQIKAENGAGDAVEMERALLGRMARRTSGDREEHYEYDARGDVIRATAGQVEVSFKRNLLGWVVRETQSVAGEAIVVDVAYNLMGQVARRSTSRGHSLIWERRGAQASVVLDGTERIDLAFDAMGRELADASRRASGSKRRTMPRGDCPRDACLTRRACPASARANRRGLARRPARSRRSALCILVSAARQAVGHDPGAHALRG